MLPPQEWPDDADTPHLKDRIVTLIALSGDDLCWSHTVAGKQEILRGTDGPLWAVWTGHYTSHLFHVPRDRARAELGLTD